MLTTEQKDVHLEHLDKAMDKVMEELGLVPLGSGFTEIPKPEPVTTKCVLPKEPEE